MYLLLQTPAAGSQIRASVWLPAAGNQLSCHATHSKAATKHSSALRCCRILQRRSPSSGTACPVHVRQCLLPRSRGQRVAYKLNLQPFQHCQHPLHACTVFNLLQVVEA